MQYDKQNDQWNGNHVYENQALFFLLKGLAHWMDLALDDMYGWFYAKVEDGVIFKIRCSFRTQKVYFNY